MRSNHEELRLATCLAILDRLKPWRRSEDLEHCWSSFPYQQHAYKTGECGGELELWEGIESSWVGHFIVICHKHALDSSFRQSWKPR
jgi:hypothetical protein